MGIFDIFKKKTKQNKCSKDDLIKEKLVNTAFDEMLKEGEHYTVKARVENNILVKKIVRWAYFDSSAQGVNALFSIETDKGVYCFQVKEKSIYLVPTDLCTSMYPTLLP